MEEIRHSINVVYDIEKHLNIILHVNKKTKTLSIVFIMAAALFLIASIINFNGQDAGYIICALLIGYVAVILFMSNTRKIYRKNLLEKNNYLGTTFKYEFYDEYIIINKTGGEIESTTKMKYSLLKNATMIENELGYILLKDNSIIFLFGEGLQPIVDFVLSKIEK